MEIAFLIFHFLETLGVTPALPHDAVLLSIQLTSFKRENFTLLLEKEWFSPFSERVKITLTSEKKNEEN